MKKLYFILTIFILALFAVSCQEEDTDSKTGYLRLDIKTNAFVNPQTKVIDEYNPKQIAVQILNASNAVVEETDDWETWAGKQFRLRPGTYTIKASSNGFDGSESGFDIPYYTGSEQITIESSKEKTANITCTLANVKVTVNFDESFINSFQSAKTTVSSKLANVNSLDFIMGSINKPAYFPVGNLSAIVSVKNKAGNVFSQTYDITNVKARDHYILNYKVAESGSVGDVNVSVDDTETIYTFTFNVSTEATTQLKANSANAWSSFAYLEGEIVSAKEELDPAYMKFEYKKSENESWENIAANTQSNNLFKATLTGLTPNTTYTYRIVYKNGSDEFASNVESFTTEKATTLYNGGFEDWYARSNSNLMKTTTWYAVSEENYKSANGPFWDSSNPGTTTDAGMFANINPTQSSTTVKHSGSKSAELKSQYKVKFAAASLYTGSFGGLVNTDGARLNFGQPFTDRPTQLHGWFKYSTAAMDYVGSNTPSYLGIVKGETPDVCSIYIALTTQTYQIDNTKIETFIDFDNDPGIVAYGVLPLSESVPTKDNWKEFSIDLQYRNLTTKPTHIIIVCSSSRYGDYFTGSTSSVMYIDDLELIYSNTPILK